MSKRNQLKMHAPIQYNMFRVKSEAANKPELNILNKYSSKEIRIAKKCLIQNPPLEKPPQYKNEILKMDNRSMVSRSKKSGSKAGKNPTALIVDLEDFDDQVPDEVDLLERDKNGIWLQKRDFFECF